MSRVERVVVVGRDAPVWIAALSVERALARTGVRVEVVELPSLLTPVDIYTAIPSLQGLHSILGLDEGAVLTAARGAPMVGQRFSSWGEGDSFILGYDAQEAPGAFPFLQLWSKARLEGMPVPFQEFSFGAMAARLGRIPSESDDAATPGATYGYHLDASAYSQLLKAVAQRRAITIHSGELAGVEVGDGRIVSVSLDGERSFTGDLFIDASGPQAALISRLDPDGFESWRQWLPCDRLISASGAALKPLPAFSQISAFDAGWVGMYPVQERTGLLAAFASEAAAADEIAGRLPAMTRLAIGGEAAVSELHAGARLAPWTGNVVAIGEAAFVLDPLDGLQLHTVHFGISQLISYWPVDSEMTIEAGEYSKVVRLHASNLRDFQAAHYKLNGRAGEPFWDKAREAQVPESLQRKLDLFSARSECPLYDEELFEAHSWAAMFLGHGLMPKGHDPRVESIPEQEHIGQIQGRLRQIAALVPTLPTVDSFLSATLIPVEVPARAS
jgi:tryptophan 7-halogenase